MDTKSLQGWRVILIVIVSFAAYYALFSIFKTIKVALDDVTHQGLVSYIITYLIVGIPIFIGTSVIHRHWNVFHHLGLTGPVTKGLLISLLFTVPMFAGGWIFFEWNAQLDPQKLIASTLIAGCMEELYFRGFLFGQIFKNTRAGFIPTVILGALLFASGHLYQSQDVSELIGIFIITFMGAVLFAWLYVEWNYNLWVPVFLHTFMNLAWALFDIDTTALGGLKANVLRGLTIALAVVVTILMKRSKQLPMAVNRKNLMQKTV